MWNIRYHTAFLLWVNYFVKVLQKGRATINTQQV